jgi:hypothetical protein
MRIIYAVFQAEMPEKPHEYCALVAKPLPSPQLPISTAAQAVDSI